MSVLGRGRFDMFERRKGAASPRFQEYFDGFDGLRSGLKPHGLHAEILSRMKVGLEIVYEDGVLGLYIEVGKRTLVDLGIRLLDARLGGYEHIIEEVVDFPLNLNEGTQRKPGIADKAAFGSLTNSGDESYKMMIHAISSPEVFPELRTFIPRKVKSFCDRGPDFIGTRLANGSRSSGGTVEDDVVKFPCLEVEPSFPRRAETRVHRADDDAAEVPDDGFDHGLCSSGTGMM